LAKKKRAKTTTNWLDELRALAYKRPLAIFRFSEEEWWDISNSRRGTGHFTVARSHASLEHVRAPTACLIFADEFGGDGHAFFALLSSRSPVSTLDTRVTIEHVHQMLPSTEEGLVALVTDKALATNLRTRLAEGGTVARLSPALSTHLIDRLAELEGNRGAMRSLIASLDVPRAYSGTGALQEDAVHMALRAFGITPYDAARSVDMVEGRETALARVNIREDAVIEHDARHIPLFRLAGSDLTGRAVFENGGERLEVITANKRPLEEVLGVDLIYLNAIKQTIVMVQYKMLEADDDQDDTDWIYRPDDQFAKEIERMKRFARARSPGPLEYRINPQVFYLKFVRRDALLGKQAITIPIDHYEVLRKDPSCKGRKGAFRISYDALDGRYLRQKPFLELIRAGYIGAHAETTADLARLVNATLKDDRAVVAAIHSFAERDA
jgi:hypothetical protein